jgi:hypothetical protein
LKQTVPPFSADRRKERKSCDALSLSRLTDILFSAVRTKNGRVRALKGELSVDVVLPKQVGSFRVVSKEKKNSAFRVVSKKNVFGAHFTFGWCYVTYCGSSAFMQKNPLSLF